MLTISLRFPGGRFHGTPWGRHVNEAAPEWPPSPYRLIRALFDVWKRKVPDWSVERVEPLLEQLSQEAPRFHLPAASASHTRSYLHKNSFDPADKTLIFDGFVVIHPETSIRICWPNVELNPGQRGDLSTMLRLLNFFGRSESWVIADVDDGIYDWNCSPAAEVEENGDYIDVACVTPKRHFAAPKRQGASKTWIEAVTYSTTQMLKDKASHPPALRLVPYIREFSALDVPPGQGYRPLAPSVRAVLYSLSGSVLPRLTKALEIGEQVRRKLMGIHRKRSGDDPQKVSCKFSGHYANGTACEGHRHCYVAPYSSGERREIDRVLIWCHEGFDRLERIALNSLGSIGWVDPKPNAVAVAWGDFDCLRPTTTIVESVTPFVPPRHYRKGRGSFAEWLQAEVRWECENHGLPTPAAIRPMDLPATRGSWRDFRRNRKGEPPRFGCGFRLDFDEPIHAPFSLGYGSHFGLGQFHSARD